MKKNTSQILNLNQIQREYKEKKIELPDLQREYVWNKTQWRSLWDDIVSVKNKMNGISMSLDSERDEYPQHFMGMLTLVPLTDDQPNQEPDQYEIVDGQQRLTTLSVLLDYLNYVCDEKQNASSLSFFRSRVKYLQVNVETVGNDEAEKKYLEIYRYFMDCHYEMEYRDSELLRNIVLNRLFFVVKISDEDKHVAFENLNATGKNLEYADLILNHLMEQDPDNGTEIKSNWHKLVERIYQADTTIEDNANEDSAQQYEDDHEDDYEDDTVPSENTYQQKESDPMKISSTEVYDTGTDINTAVFNTSPLKLKKFLNLMNSLTLPVNEPIRESIEGFDAMSFRLETFRKALYPEKQSILPPIELIDELSRWEMLYHCFTCPDKWDGILNAKCYRKEIYYLSLWNITAFLPVLTRILYRNLIITPDSTRYYGDTLVQNMMKAILGNIVHTRIFLNRKHSEDRNIEDKLRALDYIYDAYISCNKSKKNGNNKLPFLNELAEVNDAFQNTQKTNSAENIIRNYQYTSSGSKFLLALFVDEVDEKDSRVREMETENERAEVEHMVPQNLEDGTFEDYGFDVGSIGLLDNLILLSKTVNKRISNDKPLDKVDSWVNDCFGEKFVKAELKDSLYESQRKNFRNDQSSKVSKIVEKFRSYFSGLDNIVGASSKKQKYSFTFARRQMQKGNWQFMEPYFSKKPEDGDQNCHYFRLRKNRFEEHPARDTDSASEYYWYCPDEQKQQIQELQPQTYDLFELMRKYIELIASQTDCFYEWLLDCESKFDNTKKLNGSNQVKQDDNNAFTYAQKMIHTDALRKNENYGKIVGRAYDTKKIQTYSTGNLNKKILICNDYNIKDVIPTLRTIYERFSGKRRFGMWVKINRKIPVMIDGVIIQTEYHNIGDTDFYNCWMKSNPEYQGIFVSGETSEDLKADVTKDETLMRYFNLEFKSFEEMTEMTLGIPEYQRRYVWDRQNWKTLLDKIQASDGKPLYLGMIVLREDKERGVYYVVDGQQRLTTLSMLWNALASDKSVLKCLTEGHQKEQTEIRSFIDEFCKNGSCTGQPCFETFTLDNVWFDILFVEGPQYYQYDVFSSINSDGKKLTVEEKIRNYLMMKHADQSPEELIKIAYCPGFAKALCECATGQFCKSDDIYATFKRVTEQFDFEKLLSYLQVFLFIKGETDIILADRMIKRPIWILLLKELKVSTSDSLLLNWFYRVVCGDCADPKAQEKLLSDLSQKICMIYFLLYVMDRSGNSKKSANDLFLKCTDIDFANKNLAPIILNSAGDRQYWESGSDITKAIWENYIRTLDIYGIGYAHIKRFILLMLEYMMINDEDTEENWSDNVLMQATFDIEHIAPANDKEADLCERMNRIDNLMLLEAGINREIKDRGLSEKRECWINNKTDKKESGYKKSRLFMAKMFSSVEVLKKADRYNTTIADTRMNAIWDRLSKRLTEMIETVRKQDPDLVIPKRNEVTVKISVVTGSSGKKRSSIRKTQAVEKEKQSVKNLREVVQYALKLYRQNPDEEISKIKRKAINNYVKENGMESKYKSTISANCTRDIGKTTEGFEKMLYEYLINPNDSNNELNKYI